MKVWESVSSIYQIVVSLIDAVVGTIANAGYLLHSGVVGGVERVVYWFDSAWTTLTFLGHSAGIFFNLLGTKPS